MVGLSRSSSRRRFFSLSLSLSLGVLVTPALGQAERPVKRVPPRGLRDEDSSLGVPSRSGTPLRVNPLVQGEVDLCMQIVDENGVFVVHLSAVPIEDDRVRAGYLALWNDYASGRLHVYDRLLFDEDDVAEALLALKRDLRVPGDRIADVSNLPKQVAHEDPGEDVAVWRRASYPLLWEIMGFDWEADRDAQEDFGGVAHPPCFVAASDLGAYFCDSPQLVSRSARGTVAEIMVAGALRRRPSAAVHHVPAASTAAVHGSLLWRSVL